MFVKYANYALREPSGKKREKYNNRIHQEINVLLIMFKTVYDKANFAPFHKINTRGRYLMRETAFFNLS